MENEQTQTEAEAEAEPSPAPPPPPPSKRLTKRQESGWFTGVASGIGAYANVDPLWIRLAFVGSTFIGGFGLIAYILSAIFLPDPTVEEVEANPVKQRPYNEAWTTKEWYFGPGRVFTIIIFVACVLSFSSAWDFGGIDFLLAMLLVGGGIYFLSDAERARAVRDRFFGDSPAAAPASAASTAYAAPPNYRPAPPAPDPEVVRMWGERKAARRRNKHQRRLIEYATLGSAFVALGVMAVLDQADVYDIAISTFLATALLIIGIGAVVASLRVGTITLVLLGLLLTPFVIASSVIDDSVEHGIGERTWRPASVAELDSQYRLGTGRAELDLSNIRLQEGEVRTVEVDLSSGHLDITLPETVGYDVRAHVDFGQLDVLDEPNDSIGRERTIEQQRVGTGKLVINAEVHSGLLEIERQGVEEN